MKQLVFSLLMIIGVMISTSYCLTANEPCKPDCQFSNWTGVLPPHHMTVNGCAVVVKYRTRFACSTYYDVYIESIQVTGTNCAGDPPDWTIFIQQVTIALLTQNPMGFPPDTNGTCEDNWRVMKGACWLAEFTPLVEGFGGALKLLRPCIESTCCLERYQVCLSSTGERTVTFQGGTPQPCPQGTPNHCFPACNAGGR